MGFKEMIVSFLNKYPAENSNDELQKRRSYPRRTHDHCVVEMEGRTYPVENWSLGGLLLQADDRLYSEGQGVAITLKFKLRNTIIEISHDGKVVRKSNHKIAIKFNPLPQNISRSFNYVIDDMAAEQFANSQA